MSAIHCLYIRGLIHPQTQVSGPAAIFTWLCPVFRWRFKSSTVWRHILHNDGAEVWECLPLSLSSKNNLRLSTGPCLPRGSITMESDKNFKKAEPKGKYCCVCKNYGGKILTSL